MRDVFKRVSGIGGFFMQMESALRLDIDFNEIPDDDPHILGRGSGPVGHLGQWVISVLSE